MTTCRACPVFGPRWLEPPDSRSCGVRGLSSVPARPCGRERPDRLSGARGPPTWPGAFSTRLETRTKKSNGHASRRVVYETPRRNESEGRRRPPPVGSQVDRNSAGRTTAPSRPLCSVRRRKSVYARTRKMVNYARAG